MYWPARLVGLRGNGRIENDIKIQWTTVGDEEILIDISFHYTARLTSVFICRDSTIYSPYV